MNRMNKMKAWFAVVGIALLTMVFAGCGGNSTSTPATQTTASGTVTSSSGSIGTSNVTVSAPTGVSLSIPANTVLTDASRTPVSGTITTSVGYSVTTSDLIAKTNALPANTTLAAFVDISMGTVKNFSNPLSLTINVSSSGAKTGDALVVYSFDNSTSQWTFAGTEIVDANGNISPTVTHLSIWGVFKSTTPQPVKPAGVTATSGDAQVSVGWSAVNGATSYNVYYGTAAGVTSSSTNKITGATAPQMISGLTNGTTYYFVVTAVNSGGESIISAEVSATPVGSPPVKPAGITVSAGDTKATVTWSPSAGATSYNIYYTTTAGVTTTNSTKLANVTSPTVVNGLTNGTTYFFVVTALNTNGESVVSSEKSATPAATPVAPGNPTGVQVTSPAAGQASVTWNVVSGATSYNVYYLQAASAPTTATVLSTGTKLSATTPPLVISGLTSGATYYFSVTAVNAGGESAAQTNPKSLLIP